MKVTEIIKTLRDDVLNWIQGKIMEDKETWLSSSI